MELTPSYSIRDPARCLVRTIAATLLLIATGPLHAAAQTSGGTAAINREYVIKAAYLYYFSAYIEWPADVFPAEGEPFVIGIYQTDPFGTALKKIARSKAVAGHPIAIKLLQSTDGLRRCHILFVPATVPLQAQLKIFDAARGSLVLVVGESDGFVERGGDAQFFVEENKVRFAFSERAAKRADRKVSSKLLSLAKIIPGS